MNDTYRTYMNKWIRHKELNTIYKIVAVDSLHERFTVRTPYELSTNIDPVRYLDFNLIYNYEISQTLSVLYDV